MSPSTNELHTALEQGELELKGQFMFGSNYTFLVTVRHRGREFPAVYKPLRGEQPLWDFPDSTLARREVAAYLLSEALGFNFVPYTMLRQDGPFYGPGSLQQYIDSDPEYHYFNFSDADKQRLRPVVLFDLLVNNADRKGSHILVERETKKLWVIDHGLCFHHEEKLRTVLWDFAGESIPADLLVCLSPLPALLSPNSEFRASLRPYLSPREINALASRGRSLLNLKKFPAPPRDRRAYPYPPV
ncbi:MAG: SCO1664 family protein [Anaerolineae bacterium]